MLNKKFITSACLIAFLAFALFAVSFSATNATIIQSQPVGIQIGDTNLQLTAGTQNVIYGVIKISTLGNFILMQNPSGVDKFKVDVNGNITVPGKIQASEFCIGVSNCVTNWPAGGESSGWTDGGTNVYVSTSTDNVGIGITTPASKLQVNPTTNNEGIRIISSNYSPFVIRNSADTADFFRVKQDGNVCIGSDCKSSWGPNSAYRQYKIIPAPPGGEDVVCDPGYVMVGVRNTYPSQLICDRMW